MKSLFYSILFLILSCIYLVNAQSITKVSLDARDFILKDIVSASNNAGGIGTTPGTKICGFNGLNSNTGYHEIMIFPFYNQADIANGIFIHQKDGNLQIHKLVQVASDEVFILGTFNTNGSENFMVIANLSLKLNAFKFIKVVSLATDPDFILNPVDVVLFNGAYYIVGETRVDYLSTKRNKIVLMKFNGAAIEWANVYNSIAPIHSESPDAISLGPNDNLVVAGTIIRSGETEPRMFLSTFDFNGTPLAFKSVDLLFPDLKHNNKFGWTSVKSRGANIHLFAQAILATSDPGTVLVTMFDNDLNLRTWRNYTAPIRVESVNSDGNFFLFGGQAPIELGYEGFALMKVNSSNAIVEKFKNYKVELKNTNINASSTSLYDRFDDKIWTVVKPGSSAENYFVLLENPSNFADHRCADDLFSTVAKDTMRVTSLPVNTKTLEFQLADLDCLIREIPLTTQEICEVTRTAGLEEYPVKVYPNPCSNLLHIESEEMMEALTIFDSRGLELINMRIDDSLHQLPVTLPPGLYFININYPDKKTQVKKLVVD